MQAKHSKSPKSMSLQCDHRFFVQCHFSMCETTKTRCSFQSTCLWYWRSPSNHNRRKAIRVRTHKFSLNDVSTVGWHVSQAKGTVGLLDELTVPFAQTVKIKLLLLSTVVQVNWKTVPFGDYTSTLSTSGQIWQRWMAPIERLHCQTGGCNNAIHRPRTVCRIRDLPFTNKCIYSDSDESGILLYCHTVNKLTIPKAESYCNYSKYWLYPKRHNKQS